MPPETNIEILSSEPERQPDPPREIVHDLDALSAAAADLSRRLVWMPGPYTSGPFSERHKALQRALKPVLAAFRGALPKKAVGDDFRWLYDNLRLCIPISEAPRKASS